MGLLIISSMMVLGGMYLIFAFVWWILQIIANWNIFTKAGEAGWKSLIPIYGDSVSYTHLHYCRIFECNPYVSIYRIRQYP